MEDDCIFREKFQRHVRHESGEFRERQKLEWRDMLQELDVAARELNVSRQAVIKIFVRQALNQHYLAQKARSAK